MEGMKFDSDKLRWELIPMECVEEVVKVLTFGAKKYAANNWQLVEDGEDRYYAALLRHLVAHRKGEVIDPESKLMHLSHVACNVVFLLYFELLKQKNDGKS